MELERLEAQVLWRLSLLSEGAVSKLSANRISQSPSESSPPPGTDEDDTGICRPEVSLWAYHRQRLEEARGRGIIRRLTAITEAEKDYETAVRRPPTYIDPDSDKNAQDRDEAILRWIGKRPEVVAVWEACSYSYVRKVRRLHKLDQTTGEPIKAVA